MPEYFIIAHGDGPTGKVTARRAEKHPSNGMFSASGSVEIFDLPIPELALAIDVLKAVEKHRSKA
jgi:hypothetical protein